MPYFRIIPYITFSIVNAVILISINYVETESVKTILRNILSNGLFFFVAYFFYDLIKYFVTKKEKSFLVDFIKNSIANDIFVALYYFKKILHGYNLDANTLSNIFGTVNYSKTEIKNSIQNQSFLGFQIFKNNSEVRSLFADTLNNNLILKYSSHIETINLLRISNNLAKLESLLQNSNNFTKCAESAVEFTSVRGDMINPENDEKYLLLKKTKIANRFVVYDSGFFDKEYKDKLLLRYVLKADKALEIAKILNDLFSLMRFWLPDTVTLASKDSRFRIIKDYFTPSTFSNTKESKIFVADIIDMKKN